jgi:hypothetical protein
MFGFPSHLVDADAVAAYADDEFVRVTERSDRVIVELGASELEVEWGEHEEPKLSELISLRNDIIAGDMRCLYLASLNGMGIWLDEIDLDEDVAEEGSLEPPLPAGLRSLTAPLKALIDFLDIDIDLVNAAAEISPPLASDRLTDEELARWLRRLPEKDKDAYLLRVARGELNVPNELRLRFVTEHRSESSHAPLPPRRQVASLIGRAEKLREERHVAEAAHREAEEARRREESAREREARLEQLRGQEQQLWGQAEALAMRKTPSDYDRAIGLLRDLRDLAERGNGREEFMTRLDAFRAANVKKPSLMRRLDQADLR